MTSDSDSSRLFKTFAGNEVSIMTITRSSKKTTVVFVGMLLDECPEYLYLGSMEKGIYAAVRRDEIMGVTFAEEGPEETPDFEVQ